jgi:peptidoglycan-N-acetylglucosamine deacetylase
MKHIQIKIIQSLLLIMVSNTVLSQKQKPKIAFSFDDPTTKDILHFQNKVWDSLILNTLKKNNIKSILFVCGMRVNNSQGSELLSRWNKDGHLIANHTFSHYNFNSEIEHSSLENFKTDFLRADGVIKSYSNYTKLFRFPYLKEGNTPEKVNGFREFLNKNNYKHGYVSIDASDWYINNRMIDSLKTNPNRSLGGYRDVYLQHIFERALFYDQLAKEVMNRPVKHVLLLHHNLTSALFLDDLIQHFRKMGWEIITPEEAYKDPIYNETPNILPAGESIIWAKAKESGKFENKLRYPAEDGRYEKEKMDEMKL